MDPDSPIEIAPAPWSRRLRRLAWLTPFALCVAYSCVSLFSAEVLTRPHTRPPVINPKAVSPTALPWSVRTDDGVRLRGWYHPAERRRLVVLVHGLWGSWQAMAGLGRDLHALGHDVLLFDLRGHGESEPTRVSMGGREREDLRAVLAWARLHGFTPDRVGWVGQSMGASTLLMEAARNPEIRVAVIDSPYGNLPELLDQQLSRHSGLPRWFNPGILTAAHMAFGVRTDDLVPIRSARAWGRRPLLLIHGEADSTVPVRQARLIARAAGPSCRSVWLPGVEHIEGYRSDPSGYVAVVDRFLTEHLGH